MDKHLTLVPRQPGYTHEDAAIQILGLLERAAKAGAWAVDLPSRHFTWTPQLAALLDIAPSAVPTFDDALAFYAPESRELIAAAFEACMEHGRRPG
jgi:hypothetical protein